MGSVQDVHLSPGPDGQHSKQAKDSVMELETENEPKGFRSFKLDNLAAKENLSPTGMRDGLVLLSWCMVLLRTSEDGQVSFEWAYRGKSKNLNVQSLSTAEVIPTLKCRLEKAASGIVRVINIKSWDQNTLASGPASLVLSTNLLTETNSEVDFEKETLHLELHFINGSLEISPIWSTANVSPFTVTRYINALIDTIKICISKPNSPIEDCIGPTAHDLDEIWRWNHQLPPSYQFCMQDLISKRARTTPDKVAIDSWDGSLTYGQIDRYSSFLAKILKDMSGQLHEFIPLCFEKSRWTIVAVLAVMKAGRTFVMMDPTIPLARLRNMREQVGAKTMLSSRKQHRLSTSIISEGKPLVVEEDTFVQVTNQEAVPELPPVSSDTLMYIIFTSGSTGTPKGVKISHETYTSSAIPRAKAVGYTEDSRVLDFASYAFDVSIDSMLLTLANGGCLCIPSDEDRMNDINGVIRKMRVNYAGITPSVARILESDVIASLSGLGLGGEAASARDVMIWGQETRIIIGYGPCECTIGCTVNSSAATGRDYISIGTGNGAAIWIVDPNNHEKLMPVGAVGELLIEGPIVGQGYLNDPEKTAAAFIEGPKWLLVGHGNYAGRRGRLYKTGDLGKYDPDGSGGIVFAGRKDTQVKLRGQRVELGEIESQLKARLPLNTNVIAEVIVPQRPGNQATLVAFVSQSTKASGAAADISSVSLSNEMQTALSQANTELTKVLPRYMVPTAYIPVNYIPVLISGKTDRRRLRQFGATIELRNLDQNKEDKPERELNDFEQRLRQAWGQILKVDAETIRLEDNFFVLGGDSLAAMRLVSVCREQELDLTVANTFDYPTLAAMTSVIRVHNSQTRVEAQPFSMLSHDANSLYLEANELYGFDRASIEDIYPCTPTQESLFTFSLKSVEPYIAQRVACIPPSISLESWKKAWEAVVAASPILRTRLAQLQERGLLQLVLKQGISWNYSTDLDQYLSHDKEHRMDLGQPLARYTIIDDSKDGKRYMVWTIHHVLYDGWSEPIALQKVSDALKGQDVKFRTQIREFIKYVRDTDEVAMQEYWRSELKDAVGPQFPQLPSRDYVPTPDAMVEHYIPIDTRSKGSQFTMATLIRGTWALVASQYTRSDDIVFGETLTGRDIALAGVEEIVGPLIATVPVRVYVHRASSVEVYLQTIQQSMRGRTRYQHMGMQNIRKVSRDAQHACEASTGLVIQPEPEYTGDELGFVQGDVVHEALHFNPYPLMIACGIRKDGFRVCANFDSSLIDVSQMKRILKQFEVAYAQLAINTSRKLGDISCLPEAELDQIWHWNQVPPCSFDISAGQLRAGVSIRQGSAYPPPMVPWVCDPRNPSLLSPIGCMGELWLEGDVLSENIIESPAWLIAGSSGINGRSGRVHPTGDIVQLQEDGSLIYVGRKENTVVSQGHAVNISDLEAYLSRYLPSEIRAAAVTFIPSMESSSQPVEQELVVFIEQQPNSWEDSVELMWMQHRVNCEVSGSDIFEATICNTVTNSLAAALQKFNKFAQDSLSSYMTPTAYIIVEQLPSTMGRIDHELLRKLGSNIPSHVFTQVREGFTNVWAKSLSQTQLTACEEILRSSWANILGTPPEKIDVDDNFFRLGGDSVLAMKLVSNIRARGHSLTVADIFQHMRLGDAAKVLKVNHDLKREETQAYKPFSTLVNVDTEKFLSDIVRPKLKNSQWSIQDITPVTDSQALDIRGTVQAPRTSVQYTMLYFKNDIDLERLLDACNNLVKTHDILRTVFVEHHCSYFQVILDNLTTTIETCKTDLELEKHIASLCTEDIESQFELGCPFFKWLHVEGPAGQHCLVIRLSHAQYDGISLPRMFRDLEKLYIGDKITGFKPFPAYVACILDGNAQDKAIDYWKNVLNESSLSVLQGKSQLPVTKSIFRTKIVETVSLPLEDITTASLLTAAWALVLARHLKITDITFGGVTSGRVNDLENVENVVGPCYQFTPIRIRFERQWTGMDLLKFVQKQNSESAAHDFLGFEKISKTCTQWASASPERRLFFDSVVHHQDFEDFDTMPFAGGNCKVDILSPHGDSADPLKVVSFVQEGKLHVGIVGSEHDLEFVDTLLKELAKAAEELVVRGSAHIFLDSSSAC
ncbi:nonribosomal peptide synthase SidD [Talaromyces stipitatus ATCC 10500]|uniref:Nonribosomal peptide synthase SidD n=1 Tax=Talaromyces stipitatus (strain ATCC 10500 / CBS 375.48 / QM 6759 / NRRL 1006) TaxID=441959 RepID=B8MMN1_TALSN|nr:nonribosomal peptide synthase SidD [Talaromyces stipitatus ATCC 10500]EED13785.1 nonribosomal peptide synthase SidD [Talaromyces stipitatus ATCC 10500]